ncbi:MAG: bifunctional isocitrate dehydrogenase kinase/phosphatase [Chitinophagales bacterium]|nr:bifunctional isocitrate dehydrogenase kinase/phosphatase [Chitinophagales bacterium]
MFEKFEKLIPYDAAHLILTAYFQYYHLYKRITKRAQIRFEQRDWHGIQADARDRLTLYRNQVGTTTEHLLAFLEDKKEDRTIWKEIKATYLEEVMNFNTRNIAETFYNSVFRHSHKGLSVDEELMFVHATGTYREFRSTIPIYHNFYLIEPFEQVIRQLFSFYTLDAKWENLDRDIRYVTKALQNWFLDKEVLRTTRLEMLKSVFYRNKGAYIVGRLITGDRVHPFIMPLLHDERGVYVDALLLNYNEVSSIFSYNRSYFLVDVDIVSEMVDFLYSILPTKNLGELYNSIGFEKHGKTVLYRDFLRHLDRTIDHFEIAPGIKGMVMSVFTLPSYNMVFKVIRDRFAAPKKVTEKIVKEKYELVFFHDRVGRMADSHMFQNLTFPRNRFSEALLEELQSECGSKVNITEEVVEIEHLYIEKKMIPLNLYLESASPEDAEEAINEYGKAIKQLAAVNIFPGDMLLKNFGVTRLKRVVFYDYDEIGFLTEYNFRRIPEPRYYEDELSAEPWYSVGENDVFPEEFPRFLIGRRDIREIFYRLHGDLYDVPFWRQIQERLRKGEIFDVFPYRQRLRFKKQFSNNQK